MVGTNYYRDFYYILIALANCSLASVGFFCLAVVVLFVEQLVRIKV